MTEATAHQSAVCFNKRPSLGIEVKLLNSVEKSEFSVVTKNDDHPIVDNVGRMSGHREWSTVVVRALVLLKIGLNEIPMILFDIVSPEFIANRSIL